MSLSTSLNIQLPKFEGPLPLLLYLIRKDEMDIFDIKINEITTQYLEYIKLMKEFDLEVAGEFIAMAATLLQIKSRMLLPQYDENGEIIENDDPRKELVQKLLEYQKYQEASKMLYERPLLGRDVWARGLREKLGQQEDEIVLEENALFSLISAYRKALRSVKKRIHQVTKKGQSIASRILEIKDRLLIGKQVALSELVDNLSDKRRQVLITFLSALELAKMGFVSLYQTEVYQEIYIEAKSEIAGDAISRVEEYDSMRADDVAAQMMEKANKEEAAQLELAAATSGDVLATPEGEANDFVLPDELDQEMDSVVEAEMSSEDMATDEEILAAEQELDQKTDREIEA